VIRNTHLGGILAGAFDDHAFTLIPAFVTGTAEQASCRFSVAQTEALTTPGNISWQQIEERYSELLRSRPTTQEDEVKRQQQLSTLQRFVAAHRRNLSQCQGVFVNGWQRLPSDQEFLEKAAELRQQLANAEVEAFTHQGHERQKKGDLDGAIQDFSEAIRLKADDVDAITSRGLARRDKG
jgi:tetratricopeptide (TPR) repeat protein